MSYLIPCLVQDFFMDKDKRKQVTLSGKAISSKHMLS